ncbi:MAG: helix-turn-helix transcriptional regulator [Micromonosporaceae bacterium]
MPPTQGTQTSARLLRLLSLLQARRHWTGADLATRLEVTPRTVRRDVDRLRQLGYPVQATPGAAGGYHLKAGAALPPLLLDDEEAVAVGFGLGAAASGGISGIEEASIRALAKLEQVLPARLRHRLSAVRASTTPLPAFGPTADPVVLSAIAGACRSQERLRFDYRDRSGALSTRDVEPYRLVHTGRRWYLVARDIRRQAWRSFRADRITAPEPTGIRFTPYDPPDPAAFVAAAVTTNPYPVSARVRLHAPAAVMAERVPATVATLEPLDDASCVLTTGSHSLDSIAAHLALLGVDFDVWEPPELASRVRAMADRLTRASGTPDSERPAPLPAPRGES